MLSAFLWAMLAASSLLIGGLLGSYLTFGKRTLGIIMAFGAGVLISAVSYELVFEAVNLARFSGYPTTGFLLGALTFFCGDNLIEKLGGKNRKAINASHELSLVVPLLLAIILDGIPESLVIGLSVLDGSTVSLGMLVAVFISNIPEAVTGTVGMRAGGWSRAKILLLWLFIGLVCAGASAAGYATLGNLSPQWLGFVNAFAAGAILMMLANTMMPEAFEHGGKFAGVFTVLGFAMSGWVIVLEHG
jgi:ZIP family zinc transporter